MPLGLIARAACRCARPTGGFCESKSLDYLLFVGAFAFGQAQNGKLQIHHIDRGQADAAVLISPNGEVVLFDMGEDMKRKECQTAIAYLDQLGIQHIDYIFVSHYHFDHIGCIPAVLNRFPLMKDSYDRGHSYNGTTYDNYVAAVGNHRKEGKVGTIIQLDQGSANPVTLTVFAVNGDSNHGHVDTSNENDLSLAVLVTFGAFREEIGGDLSGDNTAMYQDVETPVAPDVGEIDVYKVHHHCSSHSTNNVWLADTKPTIGVISTGDGNSYGHPTEDCVVRLHEAGLQKVYWTERGAGASPEDGLDVIAGDVRIEVAPGAADYTVSHEGSTPETYQTKSSAAGAIAGRRPGGAPIPTAKTFAWSKRSTVYHVASCPDVKRILKENLVQGDTPPRDKKPAECVKSTH
jgi:beta-lactamase superfamily II metal-dependent hydrolase